MICEEEYCLGRHFCDKCEAMYQQQKAGKGTCKKCGLTDHHAFIVKSGSCKNYCWFCYQENMYNGKMYFPPTIVSDFFYQEKVGVGCEWEGGCSYKHKWQGKAHMLHFNHLKPAEKNFSIGQKLDSTDVDDIDWIWEERAKCNVLCVGHHHLVTHQQIQNGEVRCGKKKTRFFQKE